MDLGCLRQLVFTSEGLRDQWDFIVDGRLDNKSDEYKVKAYKVLEDIFVYVEVKRASGDICDEDAAGFVNVAFSIFLKSGCIEPDIIYEVYSTVRLDNTITDYEVADYSEFFCLFASAYCDSEEILQRHPSYQGKKVLVN